MTTATDRPTLDRFDHIVLCVADLAASLRFYTDVLGMEAREDRPGKYALHFGAAKISLQAASDASPLARSTLPGTGNFCMLTSTPLAQWRRHLLSLDVAIVAEGLRDGAIGPIDSLYCRDPDGNLVEVSALT